MRSPLGLLLQGVILAYRAIPKVGDHCRFHPSCSAYGLEAVRVHGGVKGSWLIIRRLARCQPWGGTGLDPVPPRRRGVSTGPPESSTASHAVLVEE